jgi:para-nitrobenzyl esterase
MTSIVETASGRLSGAEHRGVHVFRGIPYAAPPVGPLRFRPPQPPAAWSGVRAATDFGAMSPQLPSPLEQIAGSRPLVQSEDCLSLNVWTPGCDDAKRPVMVWIHGGAFTTGTAATPWYSGTTSARNGDVVVVTVNYRLGALGFTHLADLGGERWASSANCGILDQVAALAWVRDNVAGFGGDPDNVTVFGESAGGCSVVTLLATPSARGLFSRAIAQSASFRQLRSRDEANDRAERFVHELDIDSAHLDRLVDVPVEQLLSAQGKLLARRGSGTMGGTDFQAFSPAPDGTSLFEVPTEAIAAGAAAEIPVIIGTNRDEIKLFAVWDQALHALDRDGAIARLQRTLGEDTTRIFDAYTASRPGAPPSEIAMAIASDEGFRMPAIETAEIQHTHGAPTYMYLFAWESPALGGVLGASHALEIPFVFDNVHQPGVAILTGDGDDRGPLASAMNAAWTSFARDGVPEAASLPLWPQYETTERSTMVFDRSCRVEQDPLGADRRAWRDRAPEG